MLKMMHKDSLFSIKAQKSCRNVWTLSLKKRIFAPLFKKSAQGLDYGVMVALQVLVLSDWVRVPVVQHPP